MSFSRYDEHGARTSQYMHRCIGARRATHYATGDEVPYIIHNTLYSKGPVPLERIAVVFASDYKIIAFLGIFMTNASKSSQFFMCQHLSSVCIANEKRMYSKWKLIEYEQKQM